MFRGIFTAVVTPFRNGAVDYSALEKLIELQIAAGITGIVAVGTTAESPTLTMSPTRMGVILGTAAYMSPEQTHV